MINTTPLKMAAKEVDSREFGKCFKGNTEPLIFHLAGLIMSDDVNFVMIF